MVRMHTPANLISQKLVVISWLVSPSRPRIVVNPIRMPPAFGEFNLNVMGKTNLSPVVSPMPIVWVLWLKIVPISMGGTIYAIGLPLLSSANGSVLTPLAQIRNVRISPRKRNAKTSSPTTRRRENFVNGIPPIALPISIPHN